MVEIIGIVTMVALIWLLSWAMGSESESTRRSTPGFRITAGGIGRREVSIPQVA